MTLNVNLLLCRLCYAYCASGCQQKGTPKVGCGNFLRHEIYTNSVSSVETGMDMEGQIMCIEKCTFLMSSVAFLGP